MSKEMEKALDLRKSGHHRESNELLMELIKALFVKMYTYHVQEDKQQDFFEYPKKSRKQLNHHI